MPDLSITDSLGNPRRYFEGPNGTSWSSLYNYGKAELLHLLVLPDFTGLKDKTLTQAAAKPVRFKLSLHNEFQLGNTTPSPFRPAPVSVLISQYLEGERPVRRR